MAFLMLRLLGLPHVPWINLLMYLFPYIKLKDLIHLGISKRKKMELQKHCADLHCHTV